MLKPRPGLSDSQRVLWVYREHLKSGHMVVDTEHGPAVLLSLEEWCEKSGLSWRQFEIACWSLEATHNVAEVGDAGLIAISRRVKTPTSSLAAVE